MRRRAMRFVPPFDLPSNEKPGGLLASPIKRIFSFLVSTEYQEGPNQEFDWPIVDEGA